MSMLQAVLIIFLVAFLSPFLVRFLKDYSGWVLALLPAGLFGYFLSLYKGVTSGGAIHEETLWFPGLDINMSFYLDGLSLTFALLITGIGTLIVIYAGGYLKGDKYLGRFFLSILMFMGSMLGVVLADNLLALFVFWELTSFTSYLLIGFNNDKEESRNSALQALLITGTGGLALLAGAIMLGMAGGSMSISEIVSSGVVVSEHPYYLAILVLVLAGAFTKSAQFPFHFWLPGAMAAPTPVSAYLHSATMVKAGVYLLARLSPVLGDTEVWTITVTGFGAATMIIGAWLALVYTDLKRVLAYSTVMALGTITMLIGMGHPYAIQAAAVFIVGHSLYKGALFMVAGSIDHEAGTRDVLKLGGLKKLMPITAATAAIAALSMGGIPPMLGFIGKELVYEAALSFAGAPIILIILAVLANIAVVASSAIVAIRPFYGEEKKTPKHAHEAPPSMLLGPAVLGGLGLILGILPFLVDRSLFSSAASAISNTEVSFYLSLWHGFNLPLILSIVTLLGGIGVYKMWDRIRESTAMIAYGRTFAGIPEGGYRLSLNGMLSFAKFQTNMLQSGYLHVYMISLLIVTILSVGITLVLKADFIIPASSNGITVFELILALTMVGGALFAVFARKALSAITALGLLGFSIALMFIMFSAPDLAITQFLVETLTVILAALVLIKIPKPQILESLGTKVRDGVIALSVGAVITTIMLMVLNIEMDLTLSNYFGENSYTIAHGKNIVNVILVDFRALDTLGEITVLAIAAVGIIALIKLIMQTKKEEKA
jgi:multicomponent Na+:H+ antiporter subunit A